MIGRACPKVEVRAIAKLDRKFLPLLGSLPFRGLASWEGVQSIQRAWGQDLHCLHGPCIVP